MYQRNARSRRDLLFAICYSIASFRRAIAVALLPQPPRMCEHRSEIQANVWTKNRIQKEICMAVLILAVVVTIITGAHYFGRNLTKPVWLVLFILSALALLMELIAYRTLGI